MKVPVIRLKKAKEGESCMEEFLNKLAELVLGRAEGPMNFRLLLQPAVAILLALRDGMADAKAGRAPYFWSLFTEPEKRAKRLHEGWKSVSKVFLLAIVLDMVYQFLAMPRVRLFGAVIVAIILAIIPYLLIRGLVNRIMTSSKQNPE
jgi:hypothetical protein